MMSELKFLVNYPFKAILMSDDDWDDFNMNNEYSVILFRNGIMLLKR